MDAQAATWPRWFGLTLLAAGALAVSAIAWADSGVELRFESVGTGWRLATLPQQRMPLTRYSDETQIGRLVLRLEAERSYSPLVKTLNPPVALTQLAWSWRVAQQSAAIDLHSKAGDDTAAKVCVSLAWPDAWVPFVERQLLRIARARTGDDLPGATLCWVWAGDEVADALIENPYTRRVRSVVLRGRSQTGSTWFDEQRDVLKDLRRAFGDEWPANAPAPRVTAIFLAADSDNTASHSIGWIADLRYQ